MKERTAEDVIRELIDKADVRCFFDNHLRSDMPSRRKGTDEDKRRLEYNASEVGKFVLELPESDRKLLENLTPEELESFVFQFGGYDRMRPKTENNRIRGPVSLK